MNRSEAIAFLTADGGDLSVPCSRYGRRSSDCAELEEAGYSVYWSMGDVIVNDLRQLSDIQRERYYAWMMPSW